MTEEERINLELATVQVKELPAKVSAVEPRADLRSKASYSPDIHRMLPQDVEAEQGILSSFLLAPDHVGAMLAENRIDASHFHLESNGYIFWTLMEMWLGKEPIDIITLSAKLRHKGRLDQVGGAGYITGLFTFLPTAANASYYAEILEEKHTLREIIRVGTEFAARSYDEGDSAALLDQFEQRSLAIRKIQDKRKPDLKALVIETIQRFQIAQQNKGQISGLSTGFPDLDSMTDGLHPEEMIVIAARPSHGKTAILLNIAEHIACDLHKPIGIFSLEMSAGQLVQRLLSSRARVNYFAFRDGNVQPGDNGRLTAAGTDVANSKIFIDDTPGLTIQEMLAKARRWKADFNIEALFMDYLQLGRSNSRRSQDSRQAEVADVSSGCKQMARELGIPIVVLAQIDRSVEKQQRRPRLSDIKESGSVEQDADTVAFLERPEVCAENDGDRSELEGLATLSIAKQRHGPTGDAQLTFLKEFTRFETRAHTQQDESSHGKQKFANSRPPKSKRRDPEFDI